MIIMGKRNQIVLKKKNNKKQYLISMLLITVFNLVTYTQQTPHYTQYLYNMQVLNPAYVGSRSDLSISVLSRQQWVGIEGAPTTKTFSINGRTIRGLGLGLTVVNDKIGLAETTNTNIDVSYTIITSEHARLAFGLKGGLTFFSNNLSQGITPDNDIYASTSGKYPNIGFGALYYTQKFFVGFSLPYLLETPLFKTLESSNVTGVADDMNYFLSTGAIFELSDNIMFKPSTIIKYTSNLPMSIDLNANFLLRNNIETGLSYRYKNSVSALFAIIIDEKFRVGYTYDYRLTNFGSNLSSHEIVLHIDFSFNRNQRWLLHNKCFF